MSKKVMLICSTRSSLTAAAIAALVLLAGAPLFAQAKRSTAPGTQDQKALLDEIAKLKAQVERLQTTVEKCQTVGCPPAAATGAAGTQQGPGKAMEHGGMQGGKMMEHPMGGMGGMQGGGMQGGGMQGGGMQGGGMQGGGMQSGGMQGGMEHPMGGMGAGSATPMAHPPAASGMGDKPKAGMEQHMDDMHKHMDQMHGGGMAMPPSSPTAPPADPSGGMGDM